MPVLVVSNSEHSLVPAVATGITVDFAQPDQAFETVIDAVGALDIACVLATDDSCVALCSRVAEFLKLPQNSPGAAELTHRKDLGRDALRRAGCNTPDYQVITIKGASPQ